MQLFYISTSLLVLLLLCGTLLLTLRGPKMTGDSLLIVFLASLLLNALWLLLAPLVAEILQEDFPLGIADFLSRVIALTGYVCLLLFALRRKHKLPAPSELKGTGAT